MIESLNASPLPLVGQGWHFYGGHGLMLCEVETKMQSSVPGFCPGGLMPLMKQQVASSSKPIRLSSETVPTTGARNPPGNVFSPVIPFTSKKTSRISQSPEGRPVSFSLVPTSTESI